MTMHNVMDGYDTYEDVWKAIDEAKDWLEVRDEVKCILHDASCYDSTRDYEDEYNNWEETDMSYDTSWEKIIDDAMAFIKKYQAEE